MQISRRFNFLNKNIQQEKKINGRPNIKEPNSITPPEMKYSINKLLNIQQQRRDGRRGRLVKEDPAEAPGRPEPTGGRDGAGARMTGEEAATAGAEAGRREKRQRRRGPRPGDGRREKRPGDGRRGRGDGGRGREVAVEAPAAAKKNRSIFQNIFIHLCHF